MTDPNGFPVEYAGSVPGRMIGTELSAVRGLLALLTEQAREQGVGLPDAWGVVRELVTEIERYVGPRCPAVGSLGRCVLREADTVNHSDRGHYDGLSSWR